MQNNLNKGDQLINSTFVNKINDYIAIKPILLFYSYIVIVLKIVSFAIYSNQLNIQ